MAEEHECGRWIKIKNKGPSDRGGPSCEYFAEGSAGVDGPVHVWGRRSSRQSSSRQPGQNHDLLVVAVIGGVAFQHGGGWEGQFPFLENGHALDQSSGGGDA